MKGWAGVGVGVRAGDGWEGVSFVRNVSAQICFTTRGSADPPPLPPPPKDTKRGTRRAARQRGGGGVRGLPVALPLPSASGQATA